MRQKTIRIILCVLAAVFFFTEYSFAQIYTDLSLGSKGSDVRALQQLLNQDPETQIAAFGPGSPGQETDYFGPLTQQAVVVFQEKHRGDILAPLRLISGTGFVGASTRAKLNNLSDHVGLQTAPTQKTSRLTFSDILAPLRNISPSGSARVFDTQPQQATGISLQVQTDETSSQQGVQPMVTSITPSRGPDGTPVVLRGEGFLLSGNTVHAGFAMLENVQSPDGKTISFVMHHPFPDDLTIPLEVRDKVPDFPYGIVVENGNGRSEPVLFTLENTKIKERKFISEQ